MGTVINLRIFRHGRADRALHRDDSRLWGCSVCGSHSWTLATSAEVRCAGCGARAENLLAVECAAPPGLPQ